MTIRVSIQSHKCGARLQQQRQQYMLLQHIEPVNGSHERLTLLSDPPRLEFHASCVRAKHTYGID